ncbi:MAG: riboflavin synthase [Spirochaetes bacterium]|nr:riboflavin synthase [Spirochaetota bacterium]
MFTGLIEEIGSIKAINNNEIFVYCKKILEDAKIGDSISVNGLCLSITNIYSNYVSFHVSPTTKKHSRFKIGDIRVGEKVNLERALTPSTKLGEHIVLGHIDGKAKIISIKKSGEDTYFEFLYPIELKSLIVAKGSVAIDGISLTISEVMSASFIVTVIPHTLQSTNLKQKRTGDFVQIEADIFARYIYNICKNSGIKISG